MILTLVTSPAIPASDGDTLVDWQDWSSTVFEQGARENKPVLLNLEAVWCHWCHVMDQKTYSDATVAALIDAHLIAVMVDHDARPDLANRYRDFGWPATIILNGDGQDIVKRAGYIAPERFARLLRAVVEDPRPEANNRRAAASEYVQSALLTEEVRQKLLAGHYSSFDAEIGEHRSKRKSMDRNSTELALTRAARGSQRDERMARLTTDASMALIDPEWGGVYQYSTGGDWQHPHFTIVGSKGDPGALGLFDIALRHPGSYQRIE